jgi:hypothetical protein
MEEPTKKTLLQKIRGTIFFVSVCSLLQGFQSIAGLGTFMYQKEELGLKPETITFISGFIVIPYGLKPVFGYLVDWINSKISKIKSIIFVTDILK